MNSEAWTTWVCEACEHANLDLPQLKQRLSNEAVIQTEEEITQRALRWPKGDLSPDQNAFASRLIEPVLAFLLKAAEDEYLFGPLTKAYDKYGDRIDAALNSGAEEYRRLAKTFITFDTELDELAEVNRAMVLYHVLKEVELSIRSVFFPSAGPQRTAVSKREEAMRQLLAAYAPTLNRDSFFNDNPVLQSERASAGCVGAGLALFRHTILRLLVIFGIVVAIGAAVYWLTSSLLAAVGIVPVVIVGLFLFNV